MMAQGPAPASLFRPGSNCWRTDQAWHFRAVQDGAEYFRLIHDALLRAERTIFILGWDITGTVDLLPDVSAAGPPTRLDRLLAYVLERRPALECYILVWDYGTIYALERDPFTRFRFSWRMPKRLHFAFDDRHPVGGSHHQKVVVIDDRLAFSGSIDLTGHRWDTVEHRVEHPARVTPIGVRYPPYHEVQAMVDGEAARSLGVLARSRLVAFGARRLPPLADAASSGWPADVESDLTNVEVAIARTVPAQDDQPAIRECEALFIDSISAARGSIYIENQYFTSDRLADALGARLEEPAGPEVIVVTPHESHGWLEKNTMGAFRAQVFRRLSARDAHGRLRLASPMASQSRNVSTFVHSKVMVVDDELLRIGSANCANRSLGFDTECDLAVVAGGDRDRRQSICRVRNRLIGEHLGLSAEEVEAGIARSGSLRGLLDARRDRDRSLVRVQIPEPQADAPPELLRAAVDPEEPVEVGEAVESLLPVVESSGVQGVLRLWIVPATVIAAAAVVAWATAEPGSARAERLEEALPADSSNGVTAIAAVLFLVGALLFVPIEVLVLATAVLLGPVRGALAAAAGSVGSAIVGYWLGRAIGLPGVSRIVSRGLVRSGRQVAGRGVSAVAVLRLASFSSAGAVNLLCGAARLRFMKYLAGSLVGLALPIAAVVALGTLLRTVVLAPTLHNAVVATGAALGLAAAAYALRVLLLLRQFAPRAAAHRRRAEFG